MIESYDGQRVFTAAELQLLTSQSDFGVLVGITVLRDGIPVSLYVERGPLGIASMVQAGELEKTTASVVAISNQTM